MKKIVLLAIATIMGASANNNPDCAIGKDAISVKTEEVSTMENFDDYMNVTEPAMRTGSYVTGNLFAWGTATSGNMQVFERNFYAPNNFHFMPFENVWDKDSRNETCGYFKPYCWGLQGQIGDIYAMDKLIVTMKAAKQPLHSQILKDNKFELDGLDSNQAIDFLTKNKVKIADFEYHQGSINDAFIKITEKELQ